MQDSKVGYLNQPIGKQRIAYMMTYCRIYACHMIKRFTWNE